MFNSIKKLFFGGFIQTPDNNEALSNQLENEILTSDFEKRLKKLEENKEKTLRLLTDFHIQSAWILSNILITKSQAYYEALQTYEKLKTNDCIDKNGLIVNDLRKLYIQIAGA